MSGTLTRHLPRQVSRNLTERIAAGLPADPVRPAVPRAGAPTRRVRHEVRDGAAVILFSAAASTGLALTLMLLARAIG
jgi:hypothetical protein